jgi:hypothetical protein
VITVVVGAYEKIAQGDQVGAQGVRETNVVGPQGRFSEAQILVRH